MNNYQSYKTLPYVYKLTHKTTGQFYFGYRSANKVPSSEDVGTIYFSSSKRIRPIFNEFNFEVLAEFFDYTSAYIFEQQLIFEHWNDPLKLNGKYHLGPDKLWVCSKHTPETIEKIRKSKICIPAWNKGLTKDDPRVAKYAKIISSRIRSEEELEHLRTINVGRKHTAETNAKKARLGEDNGMFGKSRSADEKRRMSETRAKHTKEENIKSYSRIKSPEELSKIKATRKPFTRVTRICDRKEMDLGNFAKWLKTSLIRHHLT